MIGQKPGSGPRMGGMNPAGFSENMDENVLKQAMMGNSVSSNNSSSNNQQKSTQANTAQQNQPEPREVGTVGEEIKRGVGDLVDEVKNFFSINAWLGINYENLSPEEQQKAVEFHAKYQKLDQEQQAVAKEMYQKDMQKKRMLEEQEAKKKKIEEQQKAQSVVLPSSPKRGANVMGGSKKQRAMQKLQQDRTTLSTVQGE